MIPIQEILRLTSSLTAHLAAPDRYQRVLNVVQQLIPCDAVALLILRESALVPIAWAGLVPEVGGRIFIPNQHPRLERILNSAHHSVGPVRFPPDSNLPDPWDGSMLNDPHACAKVHACMGCALVMDGRILGLLSVDALDPSAFDNIDDETIMTFANIAAAAVHTSGLIDALELAHRKQRAVLNRLSTDGVDAKDRLIGATPIMARCRQEIDLVANSDLTVLITGETGVGKELVAAAIHSGSLRKDKPLVHINCATLSDTLAESQLFGHKKGAFTGATEDRLGLFEMADGGTLFLDEVGELPLNVQSKLLRTLQQGEIQRVGDSVPQKIDVRVIAATNRDLELEQKQGRFRADLFYRLSVYPLHVPPLRRRQDDIPLLAGFFLEREARRLGCHSLRVNHDVRQWLLLGDWPGNVRELEHVLMRAAIRARSAQREAHDVIIGLKHVELEKRHLEVENPPQSFSEKKDKNNEEKYKRDNNESSKPLPTFGEYDVDRHKTLRDQQDDFTKASILRTLEFYQGQWSASARSLGLTPSNLQRMAKRLGIEVQSKEKMS